MAGPVLAAPVINSVDIMPAQIWLGDDVNITAICSDSANSTIDRIYATITGPDVLFPAMAFSPLADRYNLIVSGSYFDRTGQFTAVITCRNIIGEEINASRGFKISKLNGHIKAVAPNPAYVSDVVEIDFVVEKDGSPLSHDVSFNVSLNGQKKELKLLPVYDVDKGWMLRIDSPSAEGSYTVEVTASYDRISVQASASLEVQGKVSFDILSIDKTWARTRDNISLTLSAMYRDGAINVNRDNLNILVNGINAEIGNLSKSGNLYVVIFTAPDLSPGTYEVRAMLGYNGSTYTATKNIYYIIPISGKIVDVNNNAVSTQIKFISGGSEVLKLSTDSSGSYSGSIQAGTYDVQLMFPKSNLYLKAASVSSFNDPVRYSYLPDVNPPGITSAGLYVYEVAITFSEATLEMFYNDKLVPDENDLKVFKCSSWNNGKNACSIDWTEVGSTIDSIRNAASVKTDTLSAYVVGTKKKIALNFNFDKPKYFLKDVVRVRGIAQDEFGNGIANVSLRATVTNTDIDTKLVSDNNGVFSIEFLSPEEEGNYTLKLSGDRYLFISSEKSKTFEVVKNQAFYLMFPDSVRIELGKNLTQEFTLANTGQTELSGFTISLTGIPSEYYAIASVPDRLAAGESKKIEIFFSVPENTTTGTSSASIKVVSTDLSKEKTFGFTIYENSKVNQTAPSSTGFLTNIYLPQPSMGEIYILLFAAIAFSLAFALKKRKKNSYDYQFASYQGGNTPLLGIKSSMRGRNHNKYGFEHSHHGELSLAEPTSNQRQPALSSDSDKSRYDRVIDIGERKEKRARR